MSSTKQAQTNEWRPVRIHTMFRRFRRGPDKKKRFNGQQPDEVIRRIVREHPIFFVRTTVPLLLSLIFFGLVVWLQTRGVAPQAFFPVLYLIAIIAIVGTALYSLYRIFELWWVNIDIITNKRILTWHGLLNNPTRDEIGIEKVTMVAVDQDTLLRILLNYGNVHLYLAGGKQIFLKNVLNPKAVRDDIDGIAQSYKASKPPKPAPPALTNDTMAGALQQLAEHEKLPTLPNADAKYAHRHSPNKLRGPLRRFGGPLRIECDVHYDAEEFTVMYIIRSIWVLIVRLILPVLLLLVTIIGALIARVLFPLFAVASVVDLVIIGLVIISYVDDVFILTNKRIIDINRKLIILSEQHDTTTYDKITKVEVKSPNVILLALSIGNLDVTTPGNNPDIHMRHIAHPFFIQDRIYEIQNFKSKFEKAKNANDQKDTLKLWFSTMLSTIQTKVTSRGVPNLQSLDLWEAVDRASQFGMRVVPIGESASYPNIESGKIVMQIPPPGTVVDTDEKPQIQVIISKR
jgi:PASTA domain-containing protein/PH (Pleckstrin Homology) domain-containing protein